MARVKYSSSRTARSSKPVATKSRPGQESVRDYHTGSYVEMPINPLNDCTVKLPDYCYVKQPELLRPKTIPHGLPTPPPENQSSYPRKRRFSSNSDTDPFCLPPPALDINVSTIYDSPLVSKLRRSCRPTPPSSPDPVLGRKTGFTETDTVDSELSSPPETSSLSASGERVGTFNKYIGPRWNKEAAARAKEFWSKTYEPFNRGRQARRPKFNYTSVMEQDMKCLEVKQMIYDRSSETISHDLICKGDIKRRKVDGDGLGMAERGAKGARSRGGESYWRAWRKYREVENREHWEIFMGWKE